MKTISKFMLAIVAGTMLLLGAIVLDWSDDVCVSLMFCGTMVSLLLLGVLDGTTSRKVRNKTLSEGYRAQASA